MTDFYDRAAALELQQREDALAKLKRFEVLPYIGCCHNCEEPLEDPLRFCDEFCRDDYDRRDAKQKTGWSRPAK
jgi:hypothetical protein